MNTKCELNVDCLKVVNYAIQQNRIPFVRSIQLYNGLDTVLQKCNLHISFSPEYAQEIDIPVGDLKAGTGAIIDDIHILLSGEFLSAMTEHVIGQLIVSLFSEGNKVCESVIQIELLTFDEWPGVETFPEILASFITPNHPAINPIVKRASSILEAWGVNKAIDAYFSNSPEKVKYIMAAIYEAIKEYNVSYCWVPASYTDGGQRIRLAHTILGDKLACCLDIACFYASCLEAVGLNPIVIIQNDHAFTGCHLVDRLLQDPSIDDASLIMKLCADGINEMMVVETTGMTEGCTKPFDEAVALANSELAEIDKFNVAVDVKRSRLAKIYPLPLSIDGTIDPSLMTADTYFSVQPSCLGTPDDINPDSIDSITKQHIWERHLLDLSLKNRLLNIRLSKEIMQLMTTDLQELEEAFATGKSFRISHIPVEWVAMGANTASFHRIVSLDPIRDLIDTDMKQQRLHAFLNEEQMQNSLKQLSYISRTSIEECGANCLYLALGLLRLSDVETGNPIYAPLILYPVDLVRKSAASGYVLKSRDEDPVLNITLIEYLRQFYQIRIGGLDPLPKDGKGIDVSMVFNTFRKAVMHKKGWDVEEYCILGIFSFSKQVLWTDLHSNSILFDSNPIVKSLKEGKLDPSIARSGENKAKSQTGVPEKLILPLDADSSQEDVIRAAVKGESFVIHGAPGTGKSQTITNIIANMLYRGKRVLFVAEKQAALEVVMNRLEAIGISDFCLPLHSNKSKKSYVLEHFKKLIGLTGGKQLNPYDELDGKFEIVEKELGNHVDAINHIHNVGLSLYDCISGYLSNDGVVVSDLDTKGWDKPALEERISALEDYRNACSILDSTGALVFAKSKLTVLPSIDPRPKMKQLRDELGILREILISAWTSLFPTIDVKSGKKNLESFEALCTSLIDWCPIKPDFLLNMDQTQMEAVKKALNVGVNYQMTRRSILDFYSDSILENDCWDLKNRLAEVMSKEFIPRIVSELKLRNDIGFYTLSGNRPSVREIQNLASNMTNLESYKMHINESEPLLKTIFGGKWNSNYDNDWLSMIADIEKAEKISSLLKVLSSSESEYQEMCDSLVCYLDKTKDKDSSEIFDVISKKIRNAMAAYDDVCSILNIDSSDSDDFFWLDYMKDSTDLWLDNYDNLREWIIYNCHRSRVVKLGLAKYIDMIREGVLQPNELVDSFMKSFYNSYADYIIASEPSLAMFHGLIHEDKARKFRRLHEDVQKMACAELRNYLLQTIPSMQEEAINGNEAGILQKNIRNNCRGLSIRNLFTQIPDLISKMCPCMLMSPLSVAQYLTADGPKFDLVIFDEASQVPTCEAIGAIARGKSVVVVGDPNQMPPSDFFTADSFDEENAYMEDLESILDDCLALSMPSRHLLWHYRSKHESLIAFSNKHFYNNKLLTFPSTDDLSPRIHFQLVEGIYDRGHSRQNSAEADAVVEEIKQRLSNKDTADMSIGVVTFNSSQQSLIEDRLNELFRKNPVLEKTAMKQTEPIFIKNLENVQGDERDVILFSIGYGVDKNGFMSLNFGPLNKEGGWRRLNVAVSRARYEMKVFSTITSDQIDLNRSTSEGVAGLKAFLNYAEKGRDALLYNTVGCAETDDGIVLSIARDLEKKGFKVQTNIGSSGYRIDLGIIDPANPGKFIAGVLCDGYNYAAAKTTKDREVVQIKILELLGWSICRIWALDYWSNRDIAISRLVERLNKIMMENKSEDIEESILNDMMGQNNNANRSEVPNMDSSQQDTSSFNETQSIVHEMLEDQNVYEVKPFFEPVIEKISEDGFHSLKEVVNDIIIQYGEMPTAAITLINNAFYEILEDNLITEDAEEYVMKSEYYNKIKEYSYDTE